MTDLTNFTDTSDVSDAAIEWVVSHGGEHTYSPISEIRDFVADGYPEDRAIIIAARLIQQHRPDLLDDPVDAAVDAWMQETGWAGCSASCREGFKRLYRAGIEKGKGA